MTSNDIDQISRELTNVLSEIVLILIRNGLNDDLVNVAMVTGSDFCLMQTINPQRPAMNSWQITKDDLWVLCCTTA